MGAPDEDPAVPILADEMDVAPSQLRCPECGSTVEKQPLCGGCARDIREGHVLGGRYRIDETLGEGGNGEVYRATDLAARSPVAIKFMLAKWLDDETQRERFKREAIALARLRHPCFVELHAVGRLARVPYIVMELADGGTLLDEIDAHPDGLAPARVATIFTQVTDALATAHASGIIHRDLKAENVVLLAGDRVKVLDLGIALLGGARFSKRLTVDGKAHGTPLYMAPEQWLCAAIGPPTDVYAIGVMIYEALVGEPPFYGLARTALRQAHLSADPPPIARPESALSTALEAIARAAMAKDPAARPSAAAVRDAIAALRFPGEPTR